MPAWLGRVHPRYATPYAALIVQAVVSMLLVILNFAVAGVQEAFQFLLSLAVVLQLVPFLYMFGALIKFGFTDREKRGRYGKPTLIAAGFSGLLTTMLGIALVFFPARQVTSLGVYETWMFGGTAFFVGLAAFFFFVYGRNKVSHPMLVGEAHPGTVKIGNKG
jgi:glutamate:GABA antiporter